MQTWARKRMPEDSRGATGLPSRVRRSRETKQPRPSFLRKEHQGHEPTQPWKESRESRIYGSSKASPNGQPSSHVSSPEDLQRGTPRLDLVETGLTAKAQDWSVDFMVMGRTPSHKPHQGTLDSGDLALLCTIRTCQDSFKCTREDKTKPET